MKNFILDLIIEKLFALMSISSTASGKFNTLTLSSSTGTDSGHKIGYDDKSIFNTLLTYNEILNTRMMSKLSYPEFKFLYKNTLPYIRSQFNKIHTLNYIERRSKDSNLYPDDLDDTSLGILAEINYFKLRLQIQSNNDLSYELVMLSKKVSNFIQILNSNYSGTYYETWIFKHTTPNQWRDNDVIVHTNIYKVLKLIKSVPDILQAYMDNIADCILNDSGLPKSKYYLSDVHILSSLTDCVTDINKKTKLLELIEKKSVSKIDEVYLNRTRFSVLKDKHLHRKISLFLIIKNSVQMYVSIKTRRFLGYELFIDRCNGSSIKYSVPMSFFCALNISNLVKYKYILAEKRNIIKSSINILSKEVKSYINSNLIHIPRKIGPDLLDWIINEPLYWAESLGQIKDPDLAKRISTDLVYGWVSMTILDDVDDNDHEIVEGFDDIKYAKKLYSECIRNLSIAEESLNKKLNLNLGLSSMFNDLGQYYLNKTDNVYLLSSKSLVHCIPSVILSLDSYCSKLKKPNAEIIMSTKDSIVEFYKYYLSIKQLSDDARDCINDLLKNQNTIVTKHLINKSKIVRQIVQKHKDRTLIDEGSRKIIYKEFINYIPIFVFKETLSMYHKCMQVIDKICLESKINSNSFKYQNNELDKYLENSYLAVIESRVYLDYTGN